MNHPIATPNRRILVVDDNAAIHDDFRKILCLPTGNRAAVEASEAEIFDVAAVRPAATAFQIDSAFQGQEGLKRVQESLAARQPYVLAFMDVRMPPGWDGIETTARIWEIDPDIQIVICTAYSDYSWNEMIARLGISDRIVILKKPFDNVEVTQLAHALAEKWQLRQEARMKMEQLEVMVSTRTSELAAANVQLKIEIAERAKTEEALRQSQKMEALGQLAGGIAHDFNNLLTVIRGYVEHLISEGQHANETLVALQEINQAAERAAKLTAQMLMFGRKKKLQPQVLDLNGILRHLGKMFQRLLGENIALQVECGDSPLEVYADPVMIEQIVLNLALNARDAMPDGGRLTISAWVKEVDEARVRDNPKARPGRFACIRVADTGCGIAQSALPHLFEPFFTTKEPGKGTGLGLATAYGIVQQHRGWIEVENEPGRGATFSIFIPVSTRTPAQTVISRSKDQVPGGQETILLVEDEPALRRLTRTLLQRSGYRVYEAGSGAEALPVWHQHSGEIDLLLTDMIMPDRITGAGLAKTLKAQKNSLKVVYTTGYSVEALRSEILLEEGVNFLAKPYSPSQLARTVRRCLDGPAAESPGTDVEARSTNL